MIALAADLAWAFVVLMAWAVVAVIVAAGALAVWFEVTGL